ncbi:cytochrome P450 domain-containing protein [Rhizoctonia solani AG-1 IA]|uniref:Cytochrome P450 domain-containing protein n=1 Tax=Thanatephorus cucumeris (strain AG1-IA) TaxID=983506 RepID=L8WHP5_THACA|nr:cytochrome P450 domain-containing protein [Rhizoctonia solani AG-1 IA]
MVDREPGYIRNGRPNICENKFVCVSDPRALQEILVKEHDAVFTHAPGHLECVRLESFPFLAGLTHEAESIILFLAQGFSESPTQAAAKGPKSRVHKSPCKVHHVSVNISGPDTRVVFDDGGSGIRNTIISTMNGADRKEINMLEWCKVTTLEAIGQAGFGYSFGALKDNHSPYIDTMKNVIPTFSSLFRLKGYIGPMFRLIPRSLSRAVAKWVPSGCIQRIGEMIDTQAKYRKARTNAHAKEEDKLSEDQLRGQINTIVFAGFETTSSSLARTIHFLAEHPHIQDQLREELQAARADLRDCDTLPYLDAIVRETLRLFPPVPTIERYASKDWVVPLRYPTQDNERQIYIEKGTRLLLSLSRANRCRQRYMG